MNNVVVFGGTGEVGQIVVEKLLARDRIVKILTRNETSKSNHTNFNLIVRKCIRSIDCRTVYRITRYCNNCAWV